MICGDCTKNIPKSVFKIQCHTCSKWHHPICAKLSELEIRVISEQKKTWFCPKCKRQSMFIANEKQLAGPTDNYNGATSHGRRTTLGGEQNDFDSLRLLIVELKTEISGLRGEVSTIQQSLEFMNGIYEEQRQTNKIMEDMIDEVKKENEKLSAEVSDLQNRISKVETRVETSKKGVTVVINGAYESNDADSTIKDKTLKILNYINGEPSNTLIENVRAIRPKNKAVFACVTIKQRTMVVDLLRKRREKGVIDSTVCGLNDLQQRIYVNEELDKNTYLLLREAMQCRRMGYKYVWCNSGSVFVRKSDGEVAVKIKDSAHLGLILNGTDES